MRNTTLPAILALLTLSACGTGPERGAISAHPAASAPAATCTAKCHSAQSVISPDPLATNGTGTAGKHVVHAGSRGISCDVCHADFTSRPNHFDRTQDPLTGSSDIVQFNITGPTGSWIAGPGPGAGSCSVACHGPALMDWQGTTAVTQPPCLGCHTSSYSSALDPFVTNGSGLSGKHEKHVQEIGLPCEKCHYQYWEKATHRNGKMDSGTPAGTPVFFDAANPKGAWTKGSGPKTGTCSGLACHNNAIMDWYGTTAWNTPASCATCHAVSVGTRRQVLGSGGDFSQESHHVINYANRGGELVKTADCLVCHDMTFHMSGTVKLKHKDNAGQVIAYNPLDPSSLEPFCLSCHDAGGATTDAVPMTPFSDGITLGKGMNVIGAKVAGFWNSANATHRNKGLTCVGTGAPSTGCHGSGGAVNAHGSLSRGLLAGNMTLPVPATAPFSYNNYKLCFDCHDSYPAVAKEVVLGYKQGGSYDIPEAPTPYYTAGIQSLFRDRFVTKSSGYPSYWLGTSQLYNNNFIFYPNAVSVPLHNFHLLGTYTQPLFSDSPNWFTWKYRGDASYVGRITCTSCHNVHGTANALRNTYDELGLVRMQGLGPDLYTRISATIVAPDTMTNYPTNCAVDCHGTNDKAGTYWHTPANE